MPCKVIPAADPVSGCSKIGYTELMKPLMESLRRMYRFRRVRGKKGEAKYDGYGFHYEIGACSPDPDEQLEAEGLAYDRERGRQPIEVLMRCAFQLGFSQRAAMAEATRERDHQRAEEDREMRKLTNEAFQKEIDRLYQLLSPEQKKKENRRRAAKKAASTRYMNKLLKKKVS